MAVEAMFRCESKKVEGGRYESINGYTNKAETLQRCEVHLQAVVGEGDDTDLNAQWAFYTPVGELMMVINNPAAGSYFEPGEEYTVRVTKRQPQKAN